MKFPFGMTYFHLFSGALLVSGIVHPGQLTLEPKKGKSCSKPPLLGSMLIFHECISNCHRGYSIAILVYQVYHRLFFGPHLLSKGPRGRTAIPTLPETVRP